MSYFVCMNKFVLISAAMLTIFSSCKEDPEPIDPCTNGFLDPGEQLPDCGGPCPPCNITQPSYFAVSVDGTPTTFDTYEMNYDGNAWYLQLVNDSLNVQVSFDSTGVIGTEPVPEAGTFCFQSGIEYPIQHAGTYSISMHDMNTQAMSGFFNIQFVRQTSITPIVYDTIKFQNGQFEYLYY